MRGIERDMEMRESIKDVTDLTLVAEDWYPEIRWDSSIHGYPVPTSKERLARLEADEAYDKMCGYEPAEGPGKPNLRPAGVPLKALPLERTRAGYKAIAASKKKPHVSDEPSKERFRFIRNSVGLTETGAKAQRFLYRIHNGRNDKRGDKAGNSEKSGKNWRKAAATDLD